MGNTFLRSVAVQTDGYVLPYPPESSWLKKKTETDTSPVPPDPTHSISRERNIEDKKSNPTEIESETNLAEIIDEMNKTNSAALPVADPLSKKRPSRKNQTQSPAIAGRSRLVKKVYVDPNSFIRDEDLHDSLSTLETSSHPSLFSVSGKSISGRVSNPSKPKPQSKMSLRKPHPPNSGEGRHLADSMDDNSVISNITLSPRTSSC
jgi:hypothetical protein